MKEKESDTWEDAKNYYDARKIGGGDTWIEPVSSPTSGWIPFAIFSGIIFGFGVGFLTCVVLYAL